MTGNLDRLKAALADRYTIEEEIGSGGMATVYLAQDIKHDRKVAVKVLKPELAAALGAERFLNEIKVTANLQHPTILPLFDSGQTESFLYYVMPYVEGESLRERLEHEGELPIGDAIRILRDVVDALTEAHVHGVVHRDIKPENVLLRGRHALVADFGVAKAISEAAGSGGQVTTAGVSLGTPTYMAPEQASADEHIDQRADIYAIGVLAYELLVGRPPFAGTSTQQVLAAHLTETPEPITKSRVNVSSSLEDLVMKCLEKNPADRWQTADELLAKLDSLVTPTGGVTPAGGLRRSKTRTRRQVVALGAAAGAVLLIVGGLGRWFGGGNEGGAAGGRDRPLVVMMDSPHPRRVYDEETRAASGTNADAISDILLDLPIIRQREAIGPDWHRDEDILRFDPDLVIIHYSGFRQEDSSGPRERLKILITFFADTDTEFLIYSRQPEDTLRTRVEDLLRDVDAEHPGLLDRIRVFGVTDYGPPQWLNPLTSTQLKLAVKEMLGLK